MIPDDPDDPGHEEDAPAKTPPRKPSKEMSDPHFNGPLAQVVRSLFHSPPDPWPADVEADVRSREATPLCVNCLFPQERQQWFCPHCGITTSEFAPVMPYMQIFPVADVLRSGVSGPPERRWGVQVFLVLLSLTQYSIFAPAYWFWMFRRARGRPICAAHRREIPEDARA